MNEMDYVMKNLTMISRLALLEDASRTRESVDSLVSVLRYMHRKSEGNITTIEDEIKIVAKMFYLYKVKKGSSFNGIIENKTSMGNQYVKAGLITEFIDIALRKRTSIHHKVLEVKLIVMMKDNDMNLVIQDNGEIDFSLEEHDLSELYEQLKQTFISDLISISVEKKVKIGTKINIIISAENKAK